METVEAREEGAYLIDLAQAALSRAYAPYSNFPVACALLTEDGSVVTGVNVENASFGLTVCAERCAIFRAIAEGHHTIKALAVVAKRPNACPCGACRQVMSEFMSAEASVYYLKQEGIGRTTVGALLPNAFTFNE